MSPVRCRRSRLAQHPMVAEQGGLHRLRALIRGEQGVSAIEFGLIAPMLFLSLLAMTDVGLALNDRIRVDHVLRAGAQPAMRDAGESYVLDTLEATACQNFSVPGRCETDLDPIEDLSVSRFCKCPGEEDDLTCTNTCPVEPRRFYRLSAAKTYQPMFLPDMEALDFQPSVLVQVR